MLYVYDEIPEGAPSGIFRFGVYGLLYYPLSLSGCVHVFIGLLVAALCGVITALLVGVVPTSRSALRNSSTFYFSTESSSDWTSPQNGNLWLDLVKTLFDPCPTGWRVPKSGETEYSPWSHFSTTNSTMQGQETTLGYYREFDETAVYGGTARYFMTGGRLHNGSLYNTTIEVQLWSSTPYGNNGYFTHFSPSSAFPSGNSGAVRTYGFSVRCIRE